MLRSRMHSLPPQGHQKIQTREPEQEKPSQPQRLRPREPEPEIRKRRISNQPAKGFFRRNREVASRRNAVTNRFAALRDATTPGADTEYATPVPATKLRSSNTTSTNSSPSNASPPNAERIQGTSASARTKAGMANGPVPSTLPTPIPNGIGSRPEAPYDPLPLRRFHLYNIRGLKTKTQNKVPTISDIAHDPIQPASMIALTETWLQDHLDAEISIPDFQPPFREDRKRKRAKRGRASGGVAVYVHEDLAAENVFSFNSGVIECIGVMVESLNLMTYTVYRQPDEPNHRSTCQHFSAFLAKLNEHLDSLPTPTPDIIVQGDLNLPHANWETGECGPAAGTSKVTRDEKRWSRHCTNCH